MSFNTVAFGIYMGHNILVEHFCRLIFSKIYVDGVKLNSYEDDRNCYDKEGTNFVFEIYEDIEYSDGSNVHENLPRERYLRENPTTNELGFSKQNGTMEIKNQTVCIKSDKKVSIKFMIEKECFGKFTFAFYIDDFRYEIGKPHGCAFMIFSGCVSQWDIKTLVYYDKEILEFINLKDRLIKQKRLNDDAAIGMIADCCI